MLPKNVTAYPARLMSPDEAKFALRFRKDVPLFIQDRWHLCGDVTEELWERLQDNRIEHNFRITAFTSTDNTMYVTFCVQLEHRQIRFLMSLSDENALRFLSEIGEVGLSLSLGRNGGNEASLIEFRIPHQAIEPLIPMVKKARRLVGMEILEELKFAVSSAMQNNFIPSVVPNFEVSQVCLNVVLPELPIPHGVYH